MKPLFYIVILLFFCSQQIHAQDPVRNAIKENENKADRDIVDKDVAEFLVKVTEDRLITINEAKLGVLKGSTSDVRNFGQLLIKDHTLILEKIKKIAAERNVTLPEGVSDKMREGQMDLSEEAGKDFDQKFINMIEEALERDIKLFERAIELKDEGISTFAKEYAPLIQSHIEKIQSIEDQDL